MRLDLVMGKPLSLRRWVLAAAVLFGAAFLMAAMESRAKGSELAPKAGKCPGCPCEVCKCDAGKPCPVRLARADGPKKKVGSEPAHDLLVTSVTTRDDGVVLIIKGEDDEFRVNIVIHPDAPIPLFVNGKRVTDQEFDKWQQKTVKIRVRVFHEQRLEDDRLEFYGGEPAYIAPATASAPRPVYYAPQWPSYPNFGGGCPNGQCPAPSRR